ncbi:MAG: tetratricopeptide (TPR) repeat protein [Candidatus Azotimanducaceae bacterium]|jgi:tetratricopeptide (TPR) repeat protein
MGSSAILYTSGHKESIADFDHVLFLYLRSKNSVMQALDNLITQDSEMPMAHLMRSYLLKLSSDPKFSGFAKASLTAAQKLPMNRREKLHSEALNAWFNGDTIKTTALLEQLLSDFPLDILALKVAHHLHFYSGNANEMRRSIARVANHYHPEHPCHGFVMGMHSFGLEESGEYLEAEKLGRQAVELNPNDQWAAHAVAHVMQMQSRFVDGIEWTANLLPTWQDSNNFIFHVHWHQALFQLGQDNLDAALSIYDKQLVAPLADDFYLDVCNAASLLWRIEMLGGQVGDRWQALQDYSARSADDELIFCTLHYLMAPARLGDQKRIQQALLQLDRWKQQHSTQAGIVAEVGEPLAQAICDLGAGKFEQAAVQLSALLPNIYKIGGSHAQRHLFEDMRHWAKVQASA